MAFKKGRSGNPAGRPTGATNNMITNIKGQIEAILTSKFTTDQIEQDIATLEPKDRLNIYLKLLEYSIPKLRATDIINEPSNSLIRIGYGDQPVRTVIKWGEKSIEI